MPAPDDRREQLRESAESLARVRAFLAGHGVFFGPWPLGCPTCGGSAEWVCGYRNPARRCECGHYWRHVGGRPVEYLVPAAAPAPRLCGCEPPPAAQPDRPPPVGL